MIAQTASVTRHINQYWYICNKNANHAELTVKSERTAVSVRPAKMPEISAELTAPVSHLRLLQSLKTKVTENIAQLLKKKKKIYFSPLFWQDREVNEK